ncbi:MAG: type VI secretion system lipoprotein TssJ [Rhodocyclaceae bacterium]|nr:type VI secretion system lipoprotein TssJ [Rhodocyclaceae bacterium]
MLHSFPLGRSPLSLLAVAFCALLAVGCSSTPDPTVVAATFQAEENLNPDSSGRPSPLVVRMYELKALSAFKDADFFSLWDNEQQTLAGDLVAREEMVLRPGDTHSIQRTTQPGTRFVGVVAAYRDLERAVWRASVPLVAHKTLPLSIKLDNRSVAITGTAQ